MANETLLETVQKIDARLERVEQFLPTLATKEELKLLATKEELKLLATKEELKLLATKAELAEAIKPLATKAELAEAIKPLATKAELAEAIRPLATKGELAEAIRPLATRAELKEALAEQRDELRRHFDTVAERIEGHVRLIAEGHTAQKERLDVAEGKNAAEHNAFDQRITSLEVSSRRPRSR